MATGRLLAFIGCLNRATPNYGAPQGRGIAVLSFDETTGALALVSETAGIDNPTFLIPSADGGNLYATSEVYGWHEGEVTAYRVDAGNGGLTYINKQPTRGSIAAQGIVDPTGRWLLVANYRMGEDGVRRHQAVAVFPIEADGGLGAVACSVAHEGTGPRADRQDGPHPHCILSNADGTRMLVADLGIDRLVEYSFDPISGALSRLSEAVLPPGTGPRHLAWAAPGIVVATGELDNAVTSLAWDGGTPKVLLRAAMLPEGFAGESAAADIHASPDGRFVYASNRGHDSIAIFAMDPEGRLQPVGHYATGRTPRHFTLDPTSRFVLVACQDGNEVTVYRRDPESGELSDLVARFAIGSPLCVRLVRVSAS